MVLQLLLRAWQRERPLLQICSQSAISMAICQTLCKMRNTNKLQSPLLLPRHDRTMQPAPPAFRNSGFC
jgi:hypothetical protein